MNDSSKNYRDFEKVMRDYHPEFIARSLPYKPLGSNTHPMLGKIVTVNYPEDGTRYFVWSHLWEPGKHKGWIQLRAIMRDEFIVNMGPVPGLDLRPTVTSFEQWLKSGHVKVLKD